MNNAYLWPLAFERTSIEDSGEPALNISQTFREGGTSTEQITVLDVGQATHVVAELVDVFGLGILPVVETVPAPAPTPSAAGAAALDAEKGKTKKP